MLIEGGGARRGKGGESGYGRVPAEGMQNAVGADSIFEMGI
jgi:hypothetical protein